MRLLVDDTESMCNARLFVYAGNKWSNTSVPLPMLAPEAIKSTTTRWSQLMMERLELNTSPLCLSEHLIIIFFGWREDLCSFVDHCAMTKTQSCSQILKEKQQLMHTKDISLTSATWTGKNQEVPPQKLELLKICSQLVPYGNKKQVYRCSKN